MYTLKDVKVVQKRLLEMAVAIRNVLEKEEIPYIITYGTLIGAVRHKGFIPWDDDFDFFLFAETYDQAMKALRAKLPKDMFVENKDSEPNYFHYWSHVKDLKTETECKLYPQDGIYEHKGLIVDLYKATRMKLKDTELNRHLQAMEYFNRVYHLGIIDDKKYQERTSELQVLIDKERLASAESNNEEIVYSFPDNKPNYFRLEELFPLKRYEFEGTYFMGPNNPDAMLRRSHGDYMTLPPEEKRKPHYSMVRFF